MAHTVLDSYVNIVRKGLMPLEDVPEKYRSNVDLKLKEEGSYDKHSNNSN